VRRTKESASAEIDMGFGDLDTNSRIRPWQTRISMEKAFGQALFPIEQGLFALSSSRNTGIPANQRAVVLPKQRAFSPPTRRARADSSAKN
jgi:hypothetical protein